MTEGYGGWFQAGVDAWWLGAEASMVAGMRLTKIAAGGAAGVAEARLMVSEKFQAGLELQADLIAGRLGSSPLTTTRKTLRHYRRKVAANRRRLAR